MKPPAPLLRGVLATMLVNPVADAAEPSIADSQDAVQDLSGPASTQNQLVVDRVDKPDLARATDNSWKTKKAGIKDATGLGFGIDYNALGLAAAERSQHIDVAAGAPSKRMRLSVAGLVGADQRA